MPISQSAKKSLRVGLRRAAENKVMKARIKNQLKSTTAENLSDTFRLLDKAAKIHVIHKNKAARLKSQLSKTVTAPVAEAPKKPAAKKTKKA